MTLDEIAGDLREMADEAAAMARKLVIPQQEYSLAEAFRKLRAAYPDEYVTVSFELRGHSSRSEPSIQWAAYSGTKGVGTHEASTIADAVNKCLLAGAKQTSEDNAVAIAQAKLDELAPAPF